MENSRTVMSLFVALSAISISGCIVVKESPAPGCIVRLGPMIGGCHGKTAIVDLTVNTESDCLSISANNCNGGILEVNNSCVETLSLDGVEIDNTSIVGLDIFKGKGGAYSLFKNESNFSRTIPERDVSMVVSGKLGSQEVKVAFTKTAKLCE